MLPPFGGEIQSPNCQMGHTQTDTNHAEEEACVRGEDMRLVILTYIVNVIAGDALLLQSHRREEEAEQKLNVQSLSLTAPGAEV